jgi:hypothetical protein
MGVRMLRVQTVAAVASAFILVLGSGLSTVKAGSPQTPPTPTPAPPQDCSKPEHREFDFWVGTWDVIVQGKPAGVNRIESDLKGCVIVERWHSASGYRGSSLNFYDRVTKAWYQTWIDDQGGALFLKGGLRERRMVLQSDPIPAAGGGTAIQRITWTPEAGGGLRQHWESSADDGRTWSSVFDGRYVKAAASR